MHEQDTTKQVRIFGELVRNNNTLPVVSSDGVYHYSTDPVTNNVVTRTQAAINTDLYTISEGKADKSELTEAINAINESIATLPGSFDVYSANVGDTIPEGATLTWDGAPVETRIAEVNETKTLIVACARVKENNADWPNPKQVRLLTFVLGHSLVATSAANDAKPFDGFQDEDIAVAQTGYNGTPQEIYFNTVKGCFVGKTGNAIQGYTYYNSWSNDADYRNNAASNVFVYTNGQVARYYRYVESGGYVMGNIINFSQLSADLKEVWGGAQVDISGKADKSYVDGQLSGKANKSEMSITAGTGANADKTTITLKEGTSATVLTQHQDISGKVDVVDGKGLSTNDYTNTDKQAVATIGNKANTSDVYSKANTYNKTEVDNKVDVAVVGAAFLGDEEGEASVADFDPRTDTLWKKEQLLTDTEKAAVKSNLGITQDLAQMRSEIDMQNAAVSLLDGHDLVVVDTLPTSESPAVAPDTDKIYRLVITDGSDVSYEDYMYTEATTSAIPKKIATYAIPGVDEVPTAGSHNLVESGGVEESIIKNIGDTSYKEFINLENIPDRLKAIIANGNWGSSIQSAHKIINVKAGERYIITANNEKKCEYAFLTNKTVTTDSQAAFVIGTGLNTIEKGISCLIVIPETCIYLYIVVSKSANNVAIPGYCPESLCRTSFYGDDYDTLLLNIEQDLSDEQKKQVKHNIGIDANLYAIQNALQWQLCGMYGKAEIWMSDGQFTAKGSTYCVSYRKVYKGELIKCVVSQNATIGYCVSIPSEGGTYSLLAALTSTGETIVEIPADGYICANFRKAFNYDVILYKLQLNNISTYFPHILEDIGLVENTGLVVDQDSANYGNVVNVGNANFFTSDFINISSFEYVAIPIIYTTSSSINYAKDSYGAIFYNENKEIVSVVDVTINTGLITSRNFAIFSKPSNVVYIRISTNGVNHKKIIGYDTNQNSIDSSTVKTIVNESIAESSKTVSAKTIFELNPDTEMLSKMVSAKKKAVSSGTTENGPTPLTFAHISDVHGASTQFARFVEFAEHWKDEGYVDEIIDTGDCVLGTYGDAIAWRDNTEGVENILTVIGNHETRATTAEKSSSNYPNGQNEWQYHSNISLDNSKRNDMYNRYFIGSDSNNPYVSNWGVTQPSNAAINGLCYYYKDYTEQNIRLIGLDVMSYNETQDTWLRSVLADAITGNYHVVILAHFPGEVMTGLNCNYTSLFSSGSDRNTIDNYNSYAHNIPISVDNFQTAGGIFVGYICGHYHRDMVNVITNYPKQLVLAVSSGGRSPIRDFTKVEGCKSYDDFQIVTIQPYHKIVKLIKVGADIDYYMRKKSTLCVSYTLVKDDGTEPGIGETATKIKGVIGEGA